MKVLFLVLSLIVNLFSIIWILIILPVRYVSINFLLLTELLFFSSLFFLFYFQYDLFYFQFVWFLEWSLVYNFYIFLGFDGISLIYVLLPIFLISFCFLVSYVNIVYRVKEFIIYSFCTMGILTYKVLRKFYAIIYRNIRIGELLQFLECMLVAAVFLLLWYFLPLHYLYNINMEIESIYNLSILQSKGKNDLYYNSRFSEVVTKGIKYIHSYVLKPVRHAVRNPSNFFNNLNSKILFILFGVGLGVGACAAERHFGFFSSCKNFFETVWESFFGFKKSAPASASHKAATVIVTTDGTTGTVDSKADADKNKENKENKDYVDQVASNGGNHPDSDGGGGAIVSNSPVKDNRLDPNLKDLCPACASKFAAAMPKPKALTSATLAAASDSTALSTPLPSSSDSFSDSTSSSVSSLSAATSATTPTGYSSSAASSLSTPLPASRSSTPEAAATISNTSLSSPFSVVTGTVPSSSSSSSRPEASAMCPASSASPSKPTASAASADDSKPVVLVASESSVSSLSAAARATTSTGTVYSSSSSPSTPGTPASATTISDTPLASPRSATPASRIASSRFLLWVQENSFQRYSQGFLYTCTKVPEDALTVLNFNERKELIIQALTIEYMDCLRSLTREFHDNAGHYSNSNSENVEMECTESMKELYNRWQIQRQGFFAAYNFFMKYLALLSHNENDHESIVFGFSYPALYPSEYNAFTEHALIPKYRTEYYINISVSDPCNVLPFPRSGATGQIEKGILKECQNVISSLMTKIFWCSDTYMPTCAEHLSLKEQLSIVENLYFADANFKKTTLKLQSINEQEQRVILQQNPDDVLALRKLHEYHLLRLQLEGAVVRYRFIRAFLELDEYGYCLSSPYPRNLFPVELDGWQSIPESLNLFEFFSLYLEANELKEFEAFPVSVATPASAATNATTPTGPVASDSTSLSTPLAAAATPKPKSRRSRR